MRPLASAALSVVLWSVAAHGADPARDAEGRKAFGAGVILLQDPDGAKYDEAFVQFKRSYELLGSWKVLGNLGLCALKLERDGEAIDAYEKYLAQGKDIDAQERAQVERDLSALRIQAVKVHFDLPGADVTLVDERDARGTKIVNKYQAPAKSIDLRMHPGDHHLVARSSTGEATWDVSFVPGSTVSHKFEIGGAKPPAAAPPVASPAAATPAAPTQPVPPASPAVDVGAEASTGGGRSRAPGLIVGGVGVAGLAVGSVFGLKAISEKGQRDDICHGGSVCPQEALDHDASARSAGLISTIGFGAGLVGVGVGAYLFFTAKPSEAKTGSVWISPRVDVGRAALEVGGAW
jgi:hypothetical protein